MSLTHSIPRSFLVVALSASAVGFADALWLCPERALRRLFALVSLLAPVALSPLLHRVFPDGFRLWSISLLVNFTDSCVSLARPSHEGLFLGHLRGVYLVGLTVLLRALPGLCHLR